MPTPPSTLLILKVEFKPALRLAITMPFITETRLRLSGTSCHNNIMTLQISNTLQNDRVCNYTETENKQTREFDFLKKKKKRYHFHLDNITGPYFRHLSTSLHFFNCFFINYLQFA